MQDPTEDKTSKEFSEPISMDEFLEIVVGNIVIINKGGESEVIKTNEVDYKQTAKKILIPMLISGAILTGLSIDSIASKFESLQINSLLNQGKIIEDIVPMDWQIDQTEVENYFQAVSDFDIETQRFYTRRRGEIIYTNVVQTLVNGDTINARVYENLGEKEASRLSLISSLYMTLGESNLSAAAQYNFWQLVLTLGSIVASSFGISLATLLAMDVEEKYIKRKRRKYSQLVQDVIETDDIQSEDDRINRLIEKNKDLEPKIIEKYSELNMSFEEILDDLNLEA